MWAVLANRLLINSSICYRREAWATTSNCPRTMFTLKSRSIRIPRISLGASPRYTLSIRICDYIRITSTPLPSPRGCWTKNESSPSTKAKSFTITQSVVSIHRTYCIEVILALVLYHQIHSSIL